MRVGHAVRHVGGNVALRDVAHRRGLQQLQFDLPLRRAEIRNHPDESDLQVLHVHASGHAGWNVRKHAVRRGRAERWGHFPEIHLPRGGRGRISAGSDFQI